MSDLIKEKARVEQIEKEIKEADEKIFQLEKQAKEELSKFPAFREINGRRFRAFKDPARIYIPIQTVKDSKDGEKQFNAVVIEGQYRGQLRLFYEMDRIIPLE